MNDLIYFLRLKYQLISFSISKPLLPFPCETKILYIYHYWSHLMCFRIGDGSSFLYLVWVSLSTWCGEINNFFFLSFCYYILWYLQIMIKIERDLRWCLHFLESLNCKSLFIDVNNSDMVDGNSLDWSWKK